MSLHLQSSAALNYTVRGSDGKEYGPVPFEQISAWTRDGRVQPHSEVRRSDMDYWARAADFTELKDAFPSVETAAAPAYRSTASAATRDPASAARLKSGASWFYWIAGLSLINSIAALAGQGWRFFFGLGITQILDGVAAEFSSSGKMIALLLDLAVAGAFVLFGVFANKRHLWAFIVGMVLFALDGVLFVIAQDWIGVGFHAFALYCLFRGLQACRQLR
ncbi:MAG TPA: DUF4339 domain-containing protein [Verrucomicrobiae bacterium]|jgi:hypothetical protein|nr:DUF4339 domain-containing protein [Verrucomicrobiae bacterium]